MIEKIGEAAFIAAAIMGIVALGAFALIAAIAGVIALDKHGHPYLTGIGVTLLVWAALTFLVLATTRHDS